jgi:hypothetical protein
MHPELYIKRVGHVTDSCQGFCHLWDLEATDMHPVHWRCGMIRVKSCAETIQKRHHYVLLLSEQHLAGSSSSSVVPLFAPLNARACYFQYTFNIVVEV